MAQFIIVIQHVVFEIEEFIFRSSCQRSESESDQHVLIPMKCLPSSPSLTNKFRLRYAKTPLSSFPPSPSPPSSFLCFLRCFPPCSFPVYLFLLSLMLSLSHFSERPSLLLVLMNRCELSCHWQCYPIFKILSRYANPKENISTSFYIDSGPQRAQRHRHRTDDSTLYMQAHRATIFCVESGYSATSERDKI